MGLTQDDLELIKTYCMAHLEFDSTLKDSSNKDFTEILGLFRTSLFPKCLFYCEPRHVQNKHFKQVFLNGKVSIKGDYVSNNYLQVAKSELCLRCEKVLVGS